MEKAGLLMLITLVPELIRQFVGAATKAKAFSCVAPLQRCNSRKGYHQAKNNFYIYININIGFSFDFIMSCFGTETLQRCNAYLRCEEKNKFVDRLFVERNFFL